MELNGGSLHNENIINSRELLQETFADDASLALGLYFWELGIKTYEDKETILIRLYDRKFSNANGVSMGFQTPFDTPVIVGDIVYNSKTDEYLICTESFNIDDIHWQGRLTLCNWILKWQNKNGDILEYPCYDINSTQYNSGEQANKQFTIGSSQHMVTLPCDENTVVLASPQRFYLDKNTKKPTSFIVTQNDTTSYNYGDKGLVKVTLYECENNNATDRPDLGICDYIDIDNNRSSSSDDVSNIKSMIFYDSTIIKSGGNEQVYTGKFFDSDGNELSNIIPQWNIICDFKDYLLIERSGNQISIGIDNDNYVDEEFKIIFSDDKNHFTSTLVVRIESLL